MAERKFPVYADGIGSITVGDDEVVLEKNGGKARFKKTYVTLVEKTGDLPLSKVEVRLEYYDMLGSKEGTEFAMHEADYHALKQLLGK